MNNATAQQTSFMLPSPQPVEFINEDGRRQSETGTRHYELPGVEKLLRGYQKLVAGRRINDQASALVRQGRMAVYPSSHGQEACQVAAVECLSEQDWLFPTYRDSVAVMARGVNPLAVMELLRGSWHSGYNPNEHKVAAQSTPLATQLLHAVGVAHAAKLRGEDTVVVALCGDGATSEGDFHAALNFAAVFHLPVVFLIQNNEYAISVPLRQQSVAPSLAHKAIGYGMPGERADGNDYAAVLAVMQHAVDRARNGGGPFLVEAHTYRMMAHTNADDATRYRSQEEVRAWDARDPLLRLRAYLRSIGALHDDDEAAFAASAESIAAELRAGLNAEVEVDPADLFRYVFAEPTPQLVEQAALLAEELSRSASDADSVQGAQP